MINELMATTEEQIRKIWEEVLGYDSISREDNFLLLGGDSISGVKIISRINRYLKKNLSVNKLFETPVLEDFVRQVTKEKSTGVEAKGLSRSSEEELPLLADQELIWLFEQLHPGTPVYHIPLVYRIRGPLDTDVLEQAVRFVAERHVALQSVFFLKTDKPCQACQKVSADFEVQSVEGVSPQNGPQGESIDKTCDKWISDQIHKPFHLETGPLFRTAVLTVGKDESILCFNFHHIIFDGWSAAVFIHELNRAYTGFLKKEAVDLPDTEFTFHDYVFSTIQKTEALWKNAEPFFQNYLQGLSSSLPEDTAGYTASVHPVVLEKDLYQGIGKTAAFYRTTPFTVLLAVFQILLFEVTGESDQVTGFARAGRDCMEEENLIGFLMNTLAARNRIRMEESFEEFLGRVKKNLDSVLEYSRVPFHRVNRFCREQGIKKDILQSLFLMQTMDFPLLDFAGVESEYLHVHTDQANTDITLELYENDAGASGWFKYRTDIFSRERIRNAGDRFRDLLSLVIQEPGSSINEMTQINTFPLSPMQHGMLMETLKAPQGAGCYIEQVVFDMNLALDVEKFQKAWEKIIQHHETLRLGFIWKGADSPVQFVTRPEPLHIDFFDWNGLPASEKQDYLDMFLKADRRRGFSLDKPPAFRITLFRMEPDKYTCAWSFHHCLADGRSMVYILRDLFQSYLDPASKLPDPGSFHDYIRWRDSRIQQAAKAFWTEKLKGFHTPLTFPFRLQEHTGPHNRRRQQHAMTLTTGLYKTTLSRDTAAEIKELCRNHGATLNTFLMGAWAILLSHYTLRRDILFGATVSVRNYETTIPDKTGMYINTLPVRIQVDPDTPLLSFLRKLREDWREIRQFEHASLTDIHAVSPVSGHLPLSEIYFSYDYETLDSALAEEKSKIRCSGVSLLERTPAAIFLTVKGREELVFSIEYDRRKFSFETIQRVLSHFTVLLKAASATPESKLKDLPILTREERRDIAEALNTLPDFPEPESCIHNLIEIQADTNKHMPAVIDRSGTMTYDELNRFANQTARFLESKGAGPEKKTLVLMEQTAQTIAVLLGILKSGCCYIPVDPSYPKERIGYIIRDADPEFIITTEPHADKAEGCKGTVIRADLEMDGIRQFDSSNPAARAAPDNAAYIIYTSGSTGAPKGVVIEHSSLVAFTRSAAEIYDIQPTDGMLQFASLSFDTSAEEIYPTLFAGASLVIKPRDVVHTPAQFFEFCTETGVTIIDLPTSYWHLICDEIDTLRIPEQIRLVIIGGDEPHGEKLEKWNKHVPSTVQLINTYGPTETTVAVTHADLTENPHAGDRVPIGRPFPHVNLAIINHFMQPAPVNVSGELYIGGPQTARGYLNQPERTGESFVKISLEGEKKRFYKTGDNATLLPSGRIVFLGRTDRQIKIRGFRVEPGEIERAAVSLDQVKECALVVSRTAGEEVKTLAFVVPDIRAAENPEDIDPGRFKSLLSEKLPAYMIPSEVRMAKELPRTASDKIDYPLLQKEAASRKLTMEYHPASNGENNAKDASQTNGPLFHDRYETGLQEIWQEILDVKEINPDDNFFDLGGSSLTSIRLVTAVEKKFHIVIPVLAVFKFPVLKELAGQLRENDTSSHFSCLHAVSRDGNASPIFFIAGTDENTDAYKDQDLKGHPFYTITVFAHKTVNGSIVPMDMWEVAGNNVSEILRADSSGPYIIIGFCRYAVAAFETASRLSGMDKEVKQLVLIDEYWRKKGVSSFVGHHLKGAFKFGPVHILKKIIPKTREKLHLMSLAFDEIKEKFYSAAGKPLPPTLQYRLMESAFWKAFDSYVPLPYHGNGIVLDTTGWKEKYDPALRSYIKGDLQRVEVPALHRELFEPAQIRAVIQALEDWKT